LPQTAVLMTFPRSVNHGRKPTPNRQGSGVGLFVFAYRVSPSRPEMAVVDFFVVQSGHFVHIISFDQADRGLRRAGIAGFLH
jgi:hypothetical protein